MAEKAIDLKVPLANDVLVAAGNVTGKTAIVEFDPRTLRIRLPFIVLGNKSYLTNSPAPAADVSAVGKGPTFSHLQLAYGGGRSTVAYPLEPGSSSDVILQGFSISPVSFDWATSPSFIGIGSATGTVVVDQVKVIHLWQVLDRAIWSHVEFSDCNIIFDGGPIVLVEVTFTNCRFEFAEDIPASMRNNLTSETMNPHNLVFRA